jgi:exonuclease III
LKNLKCFYTNARSIRNKFADLLTYVNFENPDLIFITETWLKFSIQNNKKYSQRDLKSEYEIKDYTIFYHERQEFEGGGVLTYAKNYLNPVEVNLKEDNDVESIWVDITCNKKKIRIGNFYRSDFNFNERIQKSFLIELEKGSTYNNPVIIVGDFNYRDINWNNKTCTSSLSQKFLDTCDDSFLNQLVKEKKEEKIYSH